MMYVVAVGWLISTVVDLAVCKIMESPDKDAKGPVDIAAHSHENRFVFCMMPVLFVVMSLFTDFVYYSEM